MNSRNSKEESKKLKLHSVKIAFESNPGKDVDGKGGNFQWHKYSLLVSDQEDSSKSWHSYIVELDPMGKRENEKGKGELIFSDSHGHLFSDLPINISPIDIEKSFPELFKKTEGANVDVDMNLYPKHLSNEMFSYMDIKNKRNYKPLDFIKEFEKPKKDKSGNLIYSFKLISDKADRYTPLGKLIGKTPEKTEGLVKTPEITPEKEKIPTEVLPKSAMEKTFRSAIVAASNKLLTSKDNDAISGGFDIVRKLFYKQHKKKKK